MEHPKIPTFQTYDLDLAAFLMLEGIKFFEAKKEIGENQKPRIKMVFFDEIGKARDLERVFMGSSFKKYEDYRKYLLREIHRILKGF